MAVCNFCNRKFPNAQSVRAHLKGCKAYKEHNGKPSLKMPMHTASRQPLPVRQMPRQHPQFEPPVSSQDAIRNQIEIGELNLRLREIRAAHRDLDRQENEARYDAQKEAQQAQLRKKRREIIQRVKDTVINTAMQRVPDSLKTEVKIAIEEELSTMKVEELPENELVEIAVSIRDQIYNPWLEEEKTEKENALHRLFLLSIGKQYARKRVDEEVEYSDQSKCLREIESEMEESLTGDETRADVKNIVDTVLDSMLDDEDEDDIEQ